jgi:1-deoxy-D-xylulose-5-phosphate reductoisomerase
MMLNPIDRGLFEFQEEEDLGRFPCFILAKSAFEAGLSAPCTFDAANSAAAELFIDGKIPFRAIPLAIEHALSAMDPVELSDVAMVEEHHGEAYGIARDFLRKRF